MVDRRRGYDILARQKMEWPQLVCTLLRSASHPTAVCSAGLCRMRHRCWDVFVPGYGSALPVYDIPPVRIASVTIQASSVSTREDFGQVSSAQILRCPTSKWIDRTSPIPTTQNLETLPAGSKSFLPEVKKVFVEIIIRSNGSWYKTLENKVLNVYYIVRKKIFSTIGLRSTAASKVNYERAKDLIQRFGRSKTSSVIKCFYVLSTYIFTSCSNIYVGLKFIVWLRSTSIMLKYFRRLKKLNNGRTSLIVISQNVVSMILKF